MVLRVLYRNIVLNNLRVKAPVIAIRTVAFRHHKNVGFHARSHESYSEPQCARFRGSISQPAVSFHPASDSCYQVCPRTSLLTCWLNFNQVGLFQFSIGSTHWVTISNFMNFVQFRRSRFNLARTDTLPKPKVQATKFQVHISYFLQKGKPQREDLPLLENDITNKLGPQKLAIHSRTHKVSSGCDIVLRYHRKINCLILGRYCRYL